MLCDSAKPVAMQLIEAAADANADLLVVGGFGHRPVREYVFGGVTRDMLEDARLPVLLAH